MKTLITISVFLLATLALNAQITITTDDLAQNFTNRTVTDHNSNEQIMTELNLGTGSPAQQIFDFSNLFGACGFDTLANIFENRVSQPGSIMFPNADHVSIQHYDFGSFSMHTYVYYSIKSDGLTIYGVASNTIVPGVMDTIYYQDIHPYVLAYPTPFTMNGQKAFTDTAYHVGTNNHYIENHTFTCDGYGTIMLPGGISLNTLRIVKTKLKKDFEDGALVEVESSREIEFWTKEGYSLNFKVDTNYTSGSTVPISIKYSSPGTPVGLPLTIDDTPDDYSLTNNYPNPFNPSTTIGFFLPSENKVSITIYSMLGEIVKEFQEKNYSAGYHKVIFEGSDLTSGIYFYRINAVGANGENFSATKKMLLLK